MLGDPSLLTESIVGINVHEVGHGPEGCLSQITHEQLVSTAGLEHGYSLIVGDVHDAIFLLEPLSKKPVVRLTVFLDNATEIILVGRSLVGPLEVDHEFVLHVIPAEDRLGR